MTLEEACHVVLEVVDECAEAEESAVLEEERDGAPVLRILVLTTHPRQVMVGAVVPRASDGAEVRRAAQAACQALRDQVAEFRAALAPSELCTACAVELGMLELARWCDTCQTRFLRQRTDTLAN